MNQMLSIAKKELKAYFGSPMAAIFIGAFLLSTLFSFFWLETFFARNIADIRPLFKWMPLLLIFLVAALTMRQWSEEQKMGTIEILLTLPVRLWELVMGKFLAVLTLVALALVLTLGLPITVSMLGNIDWGPVIGGYLGALLMASAYIAIGLYVSSRTDNQIVALLLTVLLSGFFYLIGSPEITHFMGNEAGEFLRALGTGSRFASIERGVVDLRDMVYYCSLTAIFLLLNGMNLDKKRWSSGRSTAGYRRTVKTAVVLIAVNLLACNIWLNAANGLRLDLTEHQRYSISQPTKDLIQNLQEPLILRGYFSAKTHPLLAPLVPQIRDLMEEYKVASGGKVKVSFVDPKYDEAAEAEANQQYGIKPVPFQVEGRYEASVVNSYFNILVKYGDQYVTLGYDDLIEIQRRQDGQLEVNLRNLEYDLTKSIKKVVFGFQDISTVFDKFKDKKLALTAIITPGSLPAPVADMPDYIKTAAKELQKESNGRLDFAIINPDDPAAGISRQEVDEQYGIQPQSASLLSDQTFYLYLFLTAGDNTEQIYLAGDMGAAEIRQEIEAALKRSGSGFLKTVGLWTPEAVPPNVPMMEQPSGSQYQIVKQLLRENYNLEEVDLSSGRVAGDIDVLMLIAPQNMSDLEKFAVDQYLMRGGSVIVLAGKYMLDLGPGMTRINLKKTKQGIGDLLSHYGVTVEDALVMDMQNEPFPIPVSKDVGGFVVQEVRQLDYPFFVDVRSEGMNSKSPVVANLPAITLNWVSPLSIDADKNKEGKFTVLLRSSPRSWLHTGTDIQPNFENYPEWGFPVGDDMASKVLAVSAQGSFTSYFADKTDPRFEKKKDHGGKFEEEDLIKGDKSTGDKEKKDRSAPLSAVIKKSPESSRLVVIGSAEFVSDTVIGIAQSMGQDRFLNSLEFLQNNIDWAVEDDTLLAIRSRGTHARLLYPLSRQEEAFWEWLNYGIALLALMLVSFYGYHRRHREVPMLLEEVGGEEKKQ